MLCFNEFAFTVEYWLQWNTISLFAGESNQQRKRNWLRELQNSGLLWHQMCTRLERCAAVWRSIKVCLQHMNRNELHLHTSSQTGLFSPEHILSSGSVHSALTPVLQLHCATARCSPMYRCVSCHSSWPWCARITNDQSMINMTQYDTRPHRRCTQIVQSYRAYYSSHGANVTII